MKKRIILTAVIIGLITEAAAIIYTIYLRQGVKCGGEYLILPLFTVTAYIVTEVLDSVRNKPHIISGRRLTRRTESGRAVLSKEAFPEYSEETLMYELSSFYPFKKAVERLCRFEEVNDLLASRSHVCEANKWHRRNNDVQK